MSTIESIQKKWEESPAIRAVSGDKPESSHWTIQGFFARLGSLRCVAKFSTSHNAELHSSNSSSPSGPSNRSAIKVLSSFWGRGYLFYPSEKTVNISLIRAQNSQRAAIENPGNEKLEQQAAQDVERAKENVQAFLTSLAPSEHNLSDDQKKEAISQKLSTIQNQTPLDAVIQNVKQSAKSPNNIWSLTKDDFSPLKINAATKAYIEASSKDSTVNLDLDGICKINTNVADGTSPYLRLDPTKGLYTSKDNSEKTSYLLRRTENWAVAQKVIELVRQKHGNAIADLMEKELRSKFKFGLDGVSYDFITVQDIQDFLAPTNVMQMPAIVASTVKPATEVIAAIDGQEGQQQNKTTVLTSNETINLKSNNAHLSRSQGTDDLTTVPDAVLPSAFCAILGMEDRRALLTGKNGFVNMVTRATNSGTITDKLTTLISSGEWPRLKIKIGKDDFSFQEDTDAVSRLISFKEEIKKLTGQSEDPSDLQALEMLTILSTAVRTAGVELTPSAKTGLAPFMSGNSETTETITITHSKEKLIFNRQLVGTLDKLRLPVDALYVISGINLNGASSYTLEYTPPATTTSNEAITSRSPIINRLNLTDSRQGFYFEQPETGIATSTTI